MNEPTLGQLTKRLDRLERESRIWKRFGAAVLVVTTGLALMGQGQSPRAVDAEQFLLRFFSAVKTEDLAQPSRLRLMALRFWLFSMRRERRAWASGLSLALQT